LNLIKSRNNQAQEDRQKLRQLGYIQELERSVGVFSNFAISFSVISVLTGLIFLYGSGPGGNGEYELYTWFFVGIFQMFMVFSLAEISSCYPIAGGVYEWTNILGNTTIGWLNGCISLIGWLACTAGINFGLSQFFLQMNGIQTPSILQLMSVCSVIVMLQTLICMMGIKTTTKINNISVGIHIIGVLTIFLLLIVFSGPNITVESLVFTDVVDNMNISTIIPVLLMAAWTLTAFDASASVSEECINPTRTVAYGMILSVIVSIVFGGLLIFGLSQGHAVLGNAGSGVGITSLNIISSIMGPTVSKFISMIIVMAMFTCGLAAQTVTVRIIYAISRNNGLPFSQIWKSVDKHNAMPRYSILLCGALEILLIITALFSEGDISLATISIKALPKITSLSTVGLYLSYGIVLFCAIGRRKKIGADRGTFFMNRIGYGVNFIAFAWSIAIAVTMLVYYNTGFKIVYAVFMLALGLYYWVHMKSKLKYRYEKLSESELLEIENMRGID